MKIEKNNFSVLVLMGFGVLLNACTQDPSLVGTDTGNADGKIVDGGEAVRIEIRYDNSANDSGLRDIGDTSLAIVGGGLMFSVDGGKDVTFPTPEKGLIFNAENFVTLSLNLDSDKAESLADVCTQSTPVRVNYTGSFVPEGSDSGRFAVDRRISASNQNGRRFQAEGDLASSALFRFGSLECISLGVYKIVSNAALDVLSIMRTREQFFEFLYSGKEGSYRSGTL